VNCLEEWRGEQRISPPGDKIHPWGLCLPLGVKLRRGLRVRIQKPVVKYL
jgi:hypothetical protein